MKINYKRMSEEEENKEKGNTGGFKGIFDFKAFAEALGVEKIEYFKFKTGPNHFDIIPHLMGDKNPTVAKNSKNKGYSNFRLYIAVHKNIGPDKAQYVCLTQFGQPCPACEESKRLKNINEADSNALKASTRNFFYVLPYIDGEVQPFRLLETGYYKSFGKLLDEEIAAAKSAGVLDFCHPEDGRVLEVRGSDENFYDKRSGKNINFVKPTRIDFNHRTQDIDEDTLGKLYNTPMDRFLIIPTYDDIEIALVGKPPVVDDPADDELITGKQEEPKKEEPTTSTGCPFNHTFGTDYEQTDDCESCCNDHEDAYDSCVKEHNKLKRQRK